MGLGYGYPQVSVLDPYALQSQALGMDYLTKRLSADYNLANFSAPNPGAAPNIQIPDWIMALTGAHRGEGPRHPGANAAGALGALTEEAAQGAAGGAWHAGQTYLDAFGPAALAQHDQAIQGAYQGYTSDMLSLLAQQASQQQDRALQTTQAAEAQRQQALGEYFNLAGQGNLSPSQLSGAAQALGLGGTPGLDQFTAGGASGLPQQQQLDIANQVIQGLASEEQNALKRNPHLAGTQLQGIVAGTVRNRLRAALYPLYQQYGPQVDQIVNNAIARYYGQSGPGPQAVASQEAPYGLQLQLANVPDWARPGLESQLGVTPSGGMVPQTQYLLQQLQSAPSWAQPQLLAQIFPQLPSDVQAAIRSRGLDAFIQQAFQG